MKWSQLIALTILLVATQMALTLQSFVETMLWAVPTNSRATQTKSNSADTHQRTYESLYDSADAGISRNKNTDPSSLEEPCELSVTTDERIWIAIPSWKNRDLLHRAIQSVTAQRDFQYHQIQAVVFEDYSSEMFRQEDRDVYESTAARSNVEVSFIRTNRHPLQNLGSAYGKWELFQYIRDHALPHEYVVVLDGDDTLADPTVVQYLYQELHRHQPLFAWGRHHGKWSDQCHDMNREVTNGDVRNGEWSYCHPRMFRAVLLNEVGAEDFQRTNMIDPPATLTNNNNDESNWNGTVSTLNQTESNIWLQKATDAAFIFKFLELAGADRSLYLGKDRALYNYTITADNGVAKFPREKVKRDNKIVRARPFSQRRMHDVYVVACVYHRNNTQSFLEHLMKTELPPGHALHIHICNNMQTRQHDLVKIAADLVANQASQIHSDDERVRSNPPHKLVIHEMEYNMGGFARFVLSRRLMKHALVEHVIMIDDDQYVRPTTLAEIYQERAPQSYKSWYGKNWDMKPEEIEQIKQFTAEQSKRRGERYHNLTVSGDAFSYWASYDPMSTNPSNRGKQLPFIASYQYGGTGMSIVDASIFRTHQLFQIDYRYRFVEDVWLSYVIGQLQLQEDNETVPKGSVKPWQIGRLTVMFEPAEELEFAKATGMWTQMNQLKEDMFRDVGYLQCSRTPRNKVASQ